MTAHRYLCTEEIADPFGSGHRHICEREVDRHLTRYVPTRVEHECACGTTWILPSPKPISEDDLPWIGPFTWLAWKWRNRKRRRWLRWAFVAAFALVFGVWAIAEVAR